MFELKDKESEEPMIEVVEPSGMAYACTMDPRRQGKTESLREIEEEMKKLGMNINLTEFQKRIAERVFNGGSAIGREDKIHLPNFRGSGILDRKFDNPFSKERLQSMGIEVRESGELPKLSIDYSKEHDECVATNYVSIPVDIMKVVLSKLDNVSKRVGSTNKADIMVSMKLLSEVEDILNGKT